MTAVRFIALVVCSALACIAFVGCAPTTQYIAARNFETGAASFVNTGADIWHEYSHSKLENCKNSVADYQSFLQCSSAWEEDAVKPADKTIVAARDTVHDVDAALAVVDAVKSGDFTAVISRSIAAITEMINVLTGLGAKMPAFKVQ